MSGINVIDSDGDRQELVDATSWHIDDRGQLHLKAGDQAVATFARDKWQSVAADSAVARSTNPASGDQS